jgi:hypothetical protein
MNYFSKEKEKSNWAHKKENKSLIASTDYIGGISRIEPHADNLQFLKLGLR